MHIRPSDPDPSRRISAPGADATPVPPAIKRPAESSATVPSAPADRAELSSAARELFARLETPSPTTASLTPERIRSVLARLRAGHYDRTEVLDHVASRVRAEFADAAPEH